MLQARVGQRMAEELCHDRTSGEAKVIVYPRKSASHGAGVIELTLESIRSVSCIQGFLPAYMQSRGSIYHGVAMALR